MVLKNFIVFEGIDGAGTTTQIKELLKRPESSSIFTTAEPTTGPSGLFLRQVLKGDIPLDARTTAYLFAADRNEHIYGKGGITEQLDAGKAVISDRYFFSSLAYQAVTCGKELPRFINSRFPLPELLFFFDVDPEITLKRIALRGGVREIYEKLDFLKQTQAEYRTVMDEYSGTGKGESMRIIRLDASRPAAYTAEIIWNYLKELPMFKA